MAHRNRVNEGPIPLNNALNQMRNVMHPNISLINLRHLNNTTPHFECDVVYLHQRIMFSTPNEVCHVELIYLLNRFSFWNQFFKYLLSIFKKMCVFGIITFLR